MFGQFAQIARKKDAMSDTRSHSGEETGGVTGRDTGVFPRACDASDLSEAGGATVRVNGVPLDWPEAGSVADLLERLGMQGKRVAVSINRSVIPRSRHGEAPVRAGDRIEILEAVGGG
jgi:sulfur carrier protein